LLSEAYQRFVQHCYAAAYNIVIFAALLHSALLRLIMNEPLDKSLNLNVSKQKHELKLDIKTI